MKRHILESWLFLTYVEFLMRFCGFKALHASIRKAPIRQVTPVNSPTSNDLCRAIDYACVFYFKPVLCLQRSSATTLLLRRYGWNAEMVIGAKLTPFQSHAWVEVEGSVVNDKSDIHDIYLVLERC
jgi:Transglutaminase-like superfamily